MVDGEAGDTERVAAVADDGREVIDLALDVGLSHPQLYAPVEHLHQRHRVDLAPVDAADRYGAAAADCFDRDVQRVESVDRRGVGDLLRQAVRQNATCSVSAPLIFTASFHTTDCRPSFGFQWNVTNVDRASALTAGRCARRSPS